MSLVSAMRACPQPIVAALDGPASRHQDVDGDEAARACDAGAQGVPADAALGVAIEHGLDLDALGFGRRSIEEAHPGLVDEAAARARDVQGHGDGDDGVEPEPAA